MGLARHVRVARRLHNGSVCQATFTVCRKMSLTLKNPHAILAVLDTRPRDVLEVRPPPEGGGPAWEAVRDLAVRHRITVGGRRAVVRGDQHRKRGRGHKPGPKSGPKTGREGGGEALVRPLAPVTLTELFADASSRAGGHGLWLALDCIQDPHNLGAMMRTAAFFGVQGALLTADRAAPLTSVAYDVAAGGVEHVPHALEVNLSRSIELAKEAGLWVLGTSEHAGEDISKVPRERPWLLVIGNEGRGIRRLTGEHCDAMCRITQRGNLDSLNASVAAGILIASLTSG